MKVWIMIYLTIAVFYDWRDFRIPNKFNGAGAVITFLLGLVSGMNIIEMAAGGVIPLIICGLLFYIGCLGGGDVKLLMVCGISMGWEIFRLLFLSFIWNGLYAMVFLWRQKSFHLRLVRFFHYVTDCISNKRILSYEPLGGVFSEEGMIHFSLGIWLAYGTCILEEML